MYYKNKEETAWYGFTPADTTDLIEITPEEWETHLKKIAPKKPTKTQLKKLEYKQEMEEIKKWLSDNDYLINKHLLGELSEERWENYLKERKEKLDRYNEVENEL